MVKSSKILPIVTEGQFSISCISCTRFVSFESSSGLMGNIACTMQATSSRLLKAWPIFLLARYNALIDMGGVQLNKVSFGKPLLQGGGGVGRY